MWWLWTNLLISAAPALVGFALVLRHRGRGRWRTWALLGFGLGVASALGFAALNAVFVARADHGSGLFLTLIGPVSMALQLVALISAGFVVAAVLTDRRDPGMDTAAESVADHVVVDDPLAYDPVDFEPPRHTS